MIDPPRATPVQPDPDLAEALRLPGKPDFLPAARSPGFTGLRQGPPGRTSPVYLSPSERILLSRNFHSRSALARVAASGGLERLCVEEQPCTN